METAEKALSIYRDNFHGDKLYQKRARKVLPVLVRQAEAGKKIFYAHLAEELDMPNPRNLNYPLGSIGRTLQEMSKSWGDQIPSIQCLVVNQNTGLPGEGISDFISDENEFKKLSAKKKNALVDGVLASVFGYDKWNSVLHELELESVSISKSVTQEVFNSTSSGMSGGGEGEEHKKLKEHVKEHPESVGIKLRSLKAETEIGLPSGDFIDVCFKNNRYWIGVEVKSKASDESDIQRGLYQCVKYQAVMEAYLSVLGQRKNVEIMLALGCKFPERLIPVRNTLGVKVVENVGSA